MAYTIIEVMDVETAKLFMNGKSQAVRLPKSCRFPGDEVAVKKVGDKVFSESLPHSPAIYTT